MTLSPTPLRIHLLIEIQDNWLAATLAVFTAVVMRRVGGKRIGAGDERGQILERSYDKSKPKYTVRVERLHL